MESRSRSRSPIRSDQGDQSIGDDISEESMNVKEKIHGERHKFPSKHQVWLSNIPATWKYEHVKKFINGAVNSKHVNDSMLFVYMRKPNKPNGPKLASIKFTNKEAAEEACELLKDVEIDGKKLNPKIMPFEPRKENQKPVETVSSIKKANSRFATKDRLMPNEFQSYGSTETYGLSTQFLESLGITPPLTTSIFISNLAPKVKEDKLEEIFSLAGKVVDVYMMRNTDGTPKGLAKITYDHPVEAVQAISMFNLKYLFGSQLLVRLDTKHSNKKVIPQGLSSIGPGLGHNGHPLQYVRAHLQIEQLKNEITQWFSTIMETSQNLNKVANLANTSAPNWQSDLMKLSSQFASPGFATSPVVNQDVQTFLQGLTQQATLLKVFSAQNTLQNVSALATGVDNQSTDQIWQGNQLFSSQSQGLADASQIANNLQPQQSSSGFQGINNTSGASKSEHQSAQKLCYTCRKPGHVTRDCKFVRCDICHREGHPAALCVSKLIGASSAQKSQLSGGRSSLREDKDRAWKSNDMSDEEGSPGYSSDMVVFRNLPPSVNNEALKNKMLEVGDVRFAELTARGKAIVRFYNPRDADRCINLFDRSKVDGQMIDVQYV